MTSTPHDTIRPRRTPRRTLLSALAATALVAAACSSDDDGDDITDTTAAEQAPQEPTTDTTQGTDPADAAVTAADGVLTDGLWQIGDAGTVEFSVSDGALQLIEAVPNDGWSMSVDVEAPDEIEVDFRQGPMEYEVEIEYENGILEIEIDLDIDPADPGTFEIGPAGIAELAVDGEAVILVNFSATEGWAIVEQDTDDGEVEIELRRDNVVWELDADIDDGVLEVEIDFEIEGAFP